MCSLFDLCVNAIWRWVIVPPDLAQSFGEISATYHCCVFTAGSSKFVCDLSPPRKGWTKLLGGLHIKKIWQYNNLTPYVTAKWSPQLIPLQISWTLHEIVTGALIKTDKVFLVQIKRPSSMMWGILAHYTLACDWYNISLATIWSWVACLFCIVHDQPLLAGKLGWLVLGDPEKAGPNKCCALI